MHDDIKKMLEAIKSSQDEYTLTPEEANALDKNSVKPLPKVKAKSLPKKNNNG